MKTNVTYHIKNWREYNRSLISRGNLSIWFSEEVPALWYSKAQPKRHRGRPCIYSDRCIEMALTLRSLFNFPLRATQGFIEGIFQWLHLDLRIPHYTQLCRRASELKVQYYSTKSRDNPTDLVVDSTGLKIYGEGEWRIRLHRKQKRRTWRKLHLSVDLTTRETVAIELTDDRVHDSSILPRLIKEQKNISKVYADGSYVSKDCFDAIAEIGGTPMIPPCIRMGVVRDNPSPGQMLRNQLVREVWAIGGRQEWKEKSTYHKRSLVENQFFRFKKILGGTLSSRVFANQVTEAKIKTLILNIAFLFLTS